MPEHTATIQPATHRYRVSLNDATLFETDRVLELQERFGDRVFPAVAYFAPDAIPFELEMSATQTTCPLKGEASYLSYGGVVDGLWTYRSPNEAVAAIAGHIGFDTSKGFRVERIEPS